MLRTPISSKSVELRSGRQIPQLRREERKLEGLVENLTDRANNQFHRIQNLVKTLDIADEIKKLSQKKNAQSQPKASTSKSHSQSTVDEQQLIVNEKQPTVNEQRPSVNEQSPSSSLSKRQATTRPREIQFKASSLFSREIFEMLKPVQAKFLEIEQILEQSEIVLHDHSNRLARLEGEIHQLNTGVEIPQTPVQPTPPQVDLMGYHRSKILEPDFVKSIYRRLDYTESRYADKSKSKSDSKGQVRLKRQNEEELSPSVKKTRFD